MSTQALLQATEKSLEMIEGKLAEAQEVARANQLAWTASEAAVMELQTEATQIRAAIRALKGEAPEPAPTECGSEPESCDSPPAEEEEETAEEFEARLKQERRRREKELREAGPYAGIKCNGCGEVGTLHDSVQTVGARQVPVIACRGCNSVKRR